MVGRVGGGQPVPRPVGSAATTRCRWLGRSAADHLAARVVPATPGEGADLLSSLTMGDDPLPPFMPGLTLSERFYRTAVEPILRIRFPGLRYAAARLGRGSDVMGFDTAQSRDHHWGPKTTLFLGEDDLARHGE